MSYVYILQSYVDLDIYIGSTNDLKRRLKEHSEGGVSSTSDRKPLKLVYYESYASEKDARNREKQLKMRGQARKQLLGRIKNSLMRKET